MCLALLALAFTAPAPIVISEIHYHPVEQPAFNGDGTPCLDLTNDVHEFVEIQNAGASTVDLSGWTLAGGTTGTAYSQALAATGGTTPYAWTLIAGTLPGGVALNGAGVLSSAPTNYGTFNFTVQLTDYAQLTTTKAFAISVPVPPLAITTVSPMVTGMKTMGVGRCSRVSCAGTATSTTGR